LKIQALTCVEKRTVEILILIISCGSLAFAFYYLYQGRSKNQRNSLISRADLIGNITTNQNPHALPSAFEGIANSILKNDADKTKRY